VLSYYSSTVTLNAEGDSQLSDEKIDSLGTAPSFLSVLFGSISRIATSQQPRHHSSYQQSDLQASEPRISSLANANWDRHQTTNEDMDERISWIQGSSKSRSQDSDELPIDPLSPQMPSKFRHVEPDFTDDIDVTPRLEQEKKSSGMSLTYILPDPGYFAAGGIAGVISRTATAPLDRLKVYLIANTGPAVKESVCAAKNGEAVKAVKQIGRPLVDATKELWKAGGIRSLFAGMFMAARLCRSLLTDTGNGLNVVKVMPESAIKFGSYEGAKRALAAFEGHGDPHSIDGRSKFVAGGLGGMASQ
jgi:solute carrier family 25 phosphate transporter 23/24/25/41